jgi:hypothetical protein
MKLDAENLRDIADMTSACAGLVTVDEESTVIRLVHYTTQEYFEQTQNRWFENAETDITIICITYLSFDVFRQQIGRWNVAIGERQLSYPFDEYATHYWEKHYRRVPVPGQALNQIALSFLKSKLKVTSSWPLGFFR